MTNNRPDAGLPPISPPTPPTPPTPPKLTAPQAPNLITPEERARTLAKMLPGQHDDVLATVEKLSAADRDALDEAIIGIVTKDNKEQAYELRRIIRFVRHKPLALPSKTFILSGGETIKAKVRKRELTAAPLDGGKVTFLTKVNLDAGTAGKSKEAYALSYKGTGVSSMRWLQFIWRMVLPEFPGGKRNTPVKLRINNKGGAPYLLTTDERKPRWSVDTSGSPPKWAFYELTKSSADELVMTDAPSAMPTDKMALDYFSNLVSPTGEKLTSAPTNVVAHFFASTYLIDGMRVLYRADIHLTWKFESATQPPQVVKLSNWALINELESVHRACLALQYPDVDYLPGPLIGVPQPMDKFDPVLDLRLTNWFDSKKLDLERYEDIADLAQANLIYDVTAKEKDTIPSSATDVVPGTAGMKAGLNYSPKFGQQGQTGYIDAGTYHNPDFPINRFGNLPDVAIKLGQTAFKLDSVVRDKSWALGTMRHEMTHAAHEQLAIGWLLKWRDELTKKTFTDWRRTFKAWLEKEHKDKRISDLDHDLILTGINNDPPKVSDLVATEVLGWIEGFVTALPFLPPLPSFQKHMLNEGTWPGAITYLAGGMVTFYKQLGTGGAVKKAVDGRIREGICSLTQARRDALKKWIGVLQKPEDFTDFPKTTPTKDEQKALGLIRAIPKDFAKQILDVEKSCPKSTA